jgi:1,4-alpha-glucan branching enzyme
VHGKGSLLAKMPGDRWRQFANLRLLFGYQFALPGKKLLFMGDEFGQRHEWDHEGGLDWDALADGLHAGVLRWVGDLNGALRHQPALYERDFDPEGFSWVGLDDADLSVLAFLRRAEDGPPLLALCNFTPVPRENLRCGVPEGGFWRELLNSDATEYGGSGVGNDGGVAAAAGPWRGWPGVLTLTAPPLACVLLTPARPEG